MYGQGNRSGQDCPDSGKKVNETVSETVRAEARAAFDEAMRFCETCVCPFAFFEKHLFVLVAKLGRCLIRLFLTVRHERLDVTAYLEDGRYRRGDGFAQRKLKTAYGEVSYGRQYLMPRGGGRGFFPLDQVLGLTWDRLSPWLMQWVARLATRMSFKAAQRICRAALNWAPATETIEQVVLGMGREAAPFLKQWEPSPRCPDGEVLIIEIDGKCPPTASEAELAKRRGKRRPRQERRDCACGCQRHRGRGKRLAKRLAQGSKKRRKKGDKSKNGKEAMVVVLYTLKRGQDGQLHGPLNKKLYATFSGRKAAALWARQEATKRGFDPDTNKTVQVVMDGANGLRQNLQRLFPSAIFTLDVCHVVERLWALGHRFHPEGSHELKEWVEKLKRLLYQGQAEELLQCLKDWLSLEPINGPGTKARRKALASVITYMEPRLDMMHYADWQRQDLVIGSGQVEGAVRHLVAERFDCAGMRWRQDKAEALLHLRCIELNGDWDHFVAWFEHKTQTRLKEGERCKILTNQPLTLSEAA